MFVRRSSSFIQLKGSLKNPHLHWFVLLNDVVLPPANHSLHAAPPPPLSAAEQDPNRIDVFLSGSYYRGECYISQRLAILRATEREDALLIAFNVHWAQDERPKFGYASFRSPGAFYDAVLCRTPIEARCFYQTIRKYLSCSLHFDVDAKGQPGFDMEAFLMRFFEAISEECSAWNVEMDARVTPEWLWRNTLLLDASVNEDGKRVCGSCHGVTFLLVFHRNHVEMKNFMTRVKQRMGEPEELDCAIYSSWRSFRFFLGVKMTADPAERRQLRLAPYNRYENTPQSERELFLLSVIPQGNPVTVHPNADDMPPPVKKIKRRKSATPMPALESVGWLAHRLLSHVRSQWNNPRATLASDISLLPTGNAYCLDLSGIVYRWDGHTHQSQRSVYVVIYAVDDHFRLHWHCHGNPQCGPKVQTLEFL